MPLRSTPLSVVLVLLLVASASAKIGSEWPTGQVLRVLASGDLSADPGLEAVAITSNGDVRVVRLSDGTVVAPLPAPFDAPVGTNFFLRDVDGDDESEIVAVFDGFGTNSTVGLLEVSGGSVARLVSDLTPNDSIGWVEVMDLETASAPALALAGRAAWLWATDTGALLYDTDSDPAIGPSWSIDGALVADFDADGLDELLLDLLEQGSGAPRVELIGSGQTATSVPEQPGPASVLLRQSHPNPSSGSTHIAFELGASAPVALRVYDASGRRVRTLIDERRTAGRHRALWDGRDEDGRAVASGIYFYELDVPGERRTRKMILLR